MEQRVWNFLYFIVIVSAIVFICKYVSIALAARYGMEAEKYKFERREGFRDIDGRFY